MRYLTIKRDREDVFLYKIIDRLYKDHSQELNHVESTILTVLLFRRNPALRKRKILQIPQPLFTSSRFITLHELAHEKVRKTSKFSFISILVL
jgi:bacterioferritin (cytochrome b1)